MAIIMWAIRVTDAVDHPAVDQSLHIQELCTSSQSHAYNLELLICCHGIILSEQWETEMVILMNQVQSASLQQPQLRAWEMVLGWHKRVLCRRLSHTGSIWGFPRLEIGFLNLLKLSCVVRLETCLAYISVAFLCDLRLWPLKDRWPTLGTGICIPGVTGLAPSALPGLCRVWWWLTGHSPPDSTVSLEVEREGRDGSEASSWWHWLDLLWGTLEQSTWICCCINCDWPLWDSSGSGED